MIWRRRPDGLESNTSTPPNTAWEDEEEFLDYVKQAKALGLNVHAILSLALGGADFCMCKLARGSFAFSIPAFCHEHDADACRLVFETHKGSRIFQVPIWYLRAWVVRGPFETDGGKTR